MNDPQPRELCLKGKGNNTKNSEWLIASWSTIFLMLHLEIGDWTIRSETFRGHEWSLGIRGAREVHLVSSCKDSSSPTVHRDQMEEHTYLVIQDNAV